MSDMENKFCTDWKITQHPITAPKWEELVNKNPNIADIIAASGITPQRFDAAESHYRLDAISKASAIRDSWQQTEWGRNNLARLDAIAEARKESYDLKHTDEEKIESFHNALMRRGFEVDNPIMKGNQ